MPRHPRPRIRFSDHLGGPGWFVITGVLLGLSFPPFPFPWLALVALVPLLARWSRGPESGMFFREAYSAFLIFAALSGYWVLFHSDTLKAFILGAGILLLPLLMALPVAGSNLIRQRFGLAWGVLALLGGWLALEFVFVAGPVPVPWLLLGHTQATNLIANQFADVAGVGGLTLWVWLVNLLVFGALRLPTLTARFAAGLATCGLIVAPIAYGAWRTTSLPASPESLRVAIAQPVLPSSDWAAVASAERVQMLADMTDEELGLPRRHAASPEPVRLVLWPEASLPVFPDARLQQMLYNRLAQWATERQLAVLAGAVTRYDTAPALTVAPYLAKGRAASHPYYNSALLFDGQREPQQYDQIRMLPVADQVPLAGWGPARHLNLGHAFATGGDRTVFRLGETAFSAAISYEIAYGDHVRQMVRNGAQFIAVLLNPSPWTFSPAQRQLEAIARLRAIESRRAVVIASVSGGSGVILPDGRLLSRAGWGDRAVVSASVPLHSSSTPYSAAGDVLYQLGGVLSLLFVVAYLGARTFSLRQRAERPKTRVRPSPPQPL